MIVILGGDFYLRCYISVSFHMVIFILGGMRFILGVVATLCHGMIFTFDLYQENMPPTA